ncbi:MAG: response regulator transcription factor [Nitrospirota bacterium]|nr:response regulator transcription factor [Nitrospirota bacterium]
MIILDLLLPGVNGTEVYRTLRKDKIHSPILIMTTQDGLQDKLEGLQTGAEDYLTKPFAFKELLERIKALQRRCAYQDLPATLHIQDLCLNKDTREVTRAGRPITRTAKEFSLLEYLMAHPNLPLS